MCALLCVRLFTFELRRIDIDTGWLDRFGVNLFFELRFARDQFANWRGDDFVQEKKGKVKNKNKNVEEEEITR